MPSAWGASSGARNTVLELWVACPDRYATTSHPEPGHRPHPQGKQKLRHGRIHHFHWMCLNIVTRLLSDGSSGGMFGKHFERKSSSALSINRSITCPSRVFPATSQRSSFMATTRAPSKRIDHIACSLIQTTTLSNGMGSVRDAPVSTSRANPTSASVPIAAHSNTPADTLTICLSQMFI